MLKIMGSILVFAAAADGRHIQKQNWQTIWHFVRGMLCGSSCRMKWNQIK